jgi:hypothetical protein
MGKRTDANQALIVRDLRKAGAFVQSLADIGKGCPDLLVLFRGDAYAMEIKDPMQPPSKQRLTPMEKEWHAQALEAHYHVYIVKTSTEALQIIGAIK